MRGDTTVGPYSKVGGEISNSVIWGYSNKGHDGFMGNTVLGQWCNLGADTNTSNLKNNYSNVKIYNYGKGQQVDTGKQFCGLIMGDHSKAGINTMFNTGTVVGVGVNVYGGGFPDKFISSYSWGGPDSEYTRYRFADFLKTAKAVMGRRKIEVSADYEKMLRYLSEADDLKSLA
jgi:UDP-N-acetylglucosamine diphosphorylase/glucosamine-1-phosphate N-acetyltransferase